MTRLWMAIRGFRWLLVPIYAAYIIAFLADRPSYLTWNGQVSHTTEAVMYGVPVLFMFLGLMEIMVREKGGIPRPNNFSFRPSTTEPLPSIQQR
ncbi:MAG: hypothetical protein WAK36_13870 [Pseudolabrys sp.]